MSDRPPREIDDRLADWVDGRMTPRERDHFVAELRVNAQLRQDLADYERTVGVLRAALRAPSAPSPMADRVLAAIAAERATAVVVPSRRWTWRHLGWSLASAAAVLALAFWIDAASGAPHDRREVAVHDTDEKKIETLALEPSVVPGDSPRPGSAGGADSERDVTESVRRLVVGEPLAGLPVTTSNESLAPDASRVEPGAAVAPFAAGKNDVKVQVPDAEGVAAGGSKDKGVGTPSGRSELREGKERSELGESAPVVTAPGAPAPAPTPPASTGPGGPGQRLRGQPADVQPQGAYRVAGASGFLAFVLVEGPARDARAIEDAAKQPAAESSALEREVRASTTGARGNEGDVVAKSLGAVVGAPPALADAALVVALDQFLARADHGDAVAGQWPTMRGELQASPLIEDVLLRVEPPARGDTARAKNPVPPALDRGWLVEGERQDVELLLQRLAAVSRERGWALRPGEVPMPKELAKLAPSPTAGGGSGGGPGQDPRSPAAPDRVRIVVRLRLHPR